MTAVGIVDPKGRQGTPSDDGTGGGTPGTGLALQHRVTRVRDGLLQEPATTTTPVAQSPLWALDRILEIDAPWSPDTLFLVPGPSWASRLRVEGVARGRIWRSCELLDVILCGVTPQDFKSIALAKLVLDAEVVGAATAGPTQTMALQLWKGMDR